MKPLYMLFALLFAGYIANAQVEMGGSYSLSIPQQEMAKNIQPLHSLNTNLFYRLPGKFSRVSVGAEIGFGMYAYISKEQDLRFPDGSGINTTVTYTSNVAMASLVSRINLFTKAKLNPYINGKAGYSSFFSNVTVEDPDDPLSCQPLDHKNIISDNTVYFAYGGGLQIDMCLFSKKQKQGRGTIDISVNKVAGGKLDYINTKNIQDHVHNDPSNPMPTPEPNKASPLNIRFVNVSTQAVHEHQVAEVYNSSLRMLDIKIGVSFRLDK